MGNSFVWVPRLAGLAMTAFLALFAVDAFDGRPLVETLPDFVIHLAPAAFCAAVVALGWRTWWAGTIGFAAMAVGYAVYAGGRMDWIAAISGPLLVTAILFAITGRMRPRPA